MPEIHVHVSNPQTPNVSPSEHQPPLTPTVPVSQPSTVPAAQAVEVIDLTDLPSTDEEDNDDIVYPLIQDLLASLDQQYPGVQYMQYNQRLVDAGFSRVNQIRDCRRTRHILLALSIPAAIVDQIIPHARRLQRHTEKQPVDVQGIKKEND